MSISEDLTVGLENDLSGMTAINIGLSGKSRGLSHGAGVELKIFGSRKIT